MLIDDGKDDYSLDESSEDESSDEDDYVQTENNNSLV